MHFIFGDHVLDPARRELRRGAELIEVEPQVFDLLLHLIRNRDRVVSKDDLLDTIWQGRIVADSTISSRIAAARRAVGDSADRPLMIRTIARRGIRFVGEVREVVGPEAAAPATEVARAMIGASPHQNVTFCRTGDGVNLAVATSGNGPPLVKAANWLNHIEFDWQSPVWVPLLTRLSSRYRLVRYDERGTGLSDWSVADISFEGFVRDLEAVVDALDLERFALFGISQGVAVSIAYATRHPERVSRLVLCGGYTQGWRKRGAPEAIAQRETMLALVRKGWGQDNPAFRQVFTSLFIPGATLEEMQWFNDLQRVSTSPENAVRLQSVFGDIDVADLPAQISVPTLVLHSRDDALIGFEYGLALARAIPRARFVTLESRNHLLLEHEPAWRRLVEEICEFLDEDRGPSTSARAAPPPKRATAPPPVARRHLPGSDRRKRPHRQT
jgi:pimeloyl-ACP methyl ester carboxylesterase/DNA-binding winged helix-turn-helix (wHTH) protein